MTSWCLTMDVGRQIDLGMYSIHLFSGAGGGLLADQLLGHTPIAACELQDYPRRVLLQRQLDGVLPIFPIWDDTKTLRADNPECAEAFDYWRSIRDNLIIAGGFPCTDISCAGKGAGIDGKQSSLWGEMARIVGEVRPRYVFVENSPLLVGRGLTRVLCDLASLRYDARWCRVSAENVGAPHRRDRFWLVANTKFM